MVSAGGRGEGRGVKEKLKDQKRKMRSRKTSVEFSDEKESRLGRHNKRADARRKENNGRQRRKVERIKGE